MSSSVSEEQETEVLYVAAEEVSSEEPPMDEWSSLVMETGEENVKRRLFAEDLYQPGSGEVCAKHIAMSDSAIFRHPYYSYPCVNDPGIEKALFDPLPKVIYAVDGQELYLAICKEMNQCPVRIFYRGLLEQEINLKYYGVNPVGVRAMALALQYNKTVKLLDLTDNFLNEDACLHLSELLVTNSTLAELNLAGCRIGPEGARRLFMGLPANRALKTLNLSRNQLGDKGMEYFAKAVFSNIDVQTISLAQNAISGKGLLLLAEALETHNKFVSIDLARNNLYAFPSGLNNLLTLLAENALFESLNLSWNSLFGEKVAASIKKVFKCKNLRHLDLSNNKFYGSETIMALIGWLAKPKKMVSFDLSNNPLSAEDALLVILKMKAPAVKVQHLLLDNVLVSSEFMHILTVMKENVKSKKDVVVTYGTVKKVYKPEGPDPREIVLNRAEYLTTRSKKQTVDVALVFMQLLKDNFVTMDMKQFSEAVREAGANLDDGLCNEIINAFPGPKTKKSKLLDMSLLVDYCKRKWPERRLPPTPPPESESEAAADGKQKGGKKKSAVAMKGKAAVGAEAEGDKQPAPETDAVDVPPVDVPPVDVPPVDVPPVDGPAVDVAADAVAADAVAADAVATDAVAAQDG